MSRIDPARTAWEFIERYGAEAEIFAAMRADQRLDAGDLDGQVLWRGVLRSIEHFRSNTPQGAPV